MSVVTDSLYSKVTTTLNRGFDQIYTLIDTHKDSIRNVVPVIKLIASLILTMVAVQLSVGLTIAFTAISFIHHLTTFSPLHNASKVFRKLWYTAFGTPAQNHQAVFALGVVASWAAPAVVIPIIAGSMIGEQLSKTIRWI